MSLPVLYVLVEVGVTKSLFREFTVTSTAEDVRMTFHENSIVVVVMSPSLVDSGRVWYMILVDNGFRVPVITLVYSAVVLRAVLSVVLELLLVSVVVVVVVVGVITVEVCLTE